MNSYNDFNKKKRLFIVRNHYGAVLMAIYAKKTFKPIYEDVLYILDASYDRNISTTVQAIKSTSQFYTWSYIYDFNTESNKSFLYFFKNGLRKVRMLRLIYKYLKKRIMTYKVNKHGPIEVNITTDSGIYRDIIARYPSIKVNYFELGIGDYSLIITNNLSERFYAYSLFAKSYKNFLKERNKKEKFVNDYFDRDFFQKICKKTLSVKAKFILDDKTCNHDRPIVFFLMQDLSRADFDNESWHSFFDKCIEKIQNPYAFHFVVKPHLLQRHETLEYVRSYFQNKNLSFSILDDLDIMQINIEVFYFYIQDRVNYVFGIYSTSIFHLSVIYPNPHTKYFYSYKFLLPYLDRVDNFLKTSYMNTRDIVMNCLSGNCEEIVVDQ